MSLLVFNSSNRIAHGVVRKLYGSGNFERIVCADVYPSYASVQRFLNFKSTLTGNSNTQVTDIQIAGKSDLAQAVSSASHVLYITHDYYSLVPSKLNLIKTTAEFAKKNKNIKSFVALTPMEHDHYGETNPIQTARTSEEDARNIYPNLVLLKSDLTFGPDSTLSHSILTRVINGLSLASSVIPAGSKANPIHTDDVAAIVEASIKDNSHEGKGYLLQGSESVNLADYVQALQAQYGKGETSSLIEKIISPAGVNFLSERLYDSNYSNLIRLLANYRTAEHGNLESVHKFKVPLKHFKSSASEGINETEYKNKDSDLARLVKNFLY